MGRYQALVFGCIPDEQTRKLVVDEDGEPHPGAAEEFTFANECADKYIGFRVAGPAEALLDGDMRAAAVDEGRVPYQRRAALSQAKSLWIRTWRLILPAGVAVPEGKLLLVEDYD
ncbi:hypothetical protein [Sorangium sp. So ce388]|uniref:hypothetical protein n=1 Tax=Sorangium sp. So ce388 TaxID=3133309 RepID=UPI003F5BCAA4